MSAAAKSEDWRDALRAMRDLLTLTERHPDFLPRAVDVADEDLDAEILRRLAESHPCLRCGGGAEVTYLVSRQDYTWQCWFDLCRGCTVLLRTVINDERSQRLGFS